MKILIGIVGLLVAQITMAQVNLNVPFQEQEYSEWCWAGTTTSILGYYGQSHNQCDIANFTRTQDPSFHDFGTEDCCNMGSTFYNSGDCNYWNYNWGSNPGNIEDILEIFGGLSETHVSSSLSLADYKAEMDLGYPIVIRWGWDNGGGHFIVGEGYSDSSMYLMNPWPNEGYKISDYDWVVDGSTHTWTHSQRTVGPIPSSSSMGSSSSSDSISSSSSLVSSSSSSELPSSSSSLASSSSSSELLSSSSSIVVSSSSSELLSSSSSLVSSSSSLELISSSSSFVVSSSSEVVGIVNQSSFFAQILRSTTQGIYVQLAAGFTHLRVYNITGKQLFEWHGFLSSGEQLIPWNLTTGKYMVQIQQNSNTFKQFVEVQ